MRKGEVWFVKFPFEEDKTQTTNRPVVVLDENILGVLSVKITKHRVRASDPYDVPILYWEDAHLKMASTARISKITKSLRAFIPWIYPWDKGPLF